MYNWWGLYGWLYNGFFTSNEDSRTISPFMFLSGWLVGCLVVIFLLRSELVVSHF